jgi:hypothetical protein
MQPIVNGIKKEFKACLHLERVNLSSETQWHVLLSPIGTPEFALLDLSGNIIHRWVGFTEKDEFVEVMKPLCG